MEPKYIIMSDFDGVICDSERHFFENLAQQINKNTGLTLKGEDLECEFSGLNMLTLKQKIENKFNDQFSDNFDAFWTTFIEPMEGDKTVTAISEMKALYEDINKTPLLNLFVVSNSRKAGLDTKTDKAGLRDLFQERVHSFQDFNPDMPKPNPDPYIGAARQYGVHEISKSNSIVIEDSVTGATAGINSGAYVIGFIDPTNRSQNFIDFRKKALMDLGVDVVCIGADEVRIALEEQTGLSITKTPANDDPASAQYSDFTDDMNFA